ncbi:hypothetical protein KJ059_14945 [Myxococcota bacterium]|nr:hypothetical protein [Myxococcota bacterium]MCZ7617659.1 hypothetical protein [Myxococcota bacterium]
MITRPPASSQPSGSFWPALVVLALTLGCASTPSSRGLHQFDYFSEIGLGGEDDAWYPKVVEWQSRARREGTRLPSTERSLRSAEFSGQLQNSMSAFRNSERRELARRITDWSQRIARSHYRFDPGSNAAEYDRWPTVGELLANNGDDCDGLDLIAYQLLREFGFPPDQLFRAVVRRNRDQANHMVTLWFEDPEDPWILDATGAVSVKFRRVSELEGWTPTKVFNERQQFTVSKRATGQPVAHNE